MVHFRRGGVKILWNKDLVCVASVCGGLEGTLLVGESFTENVKMDDTPRNKKGEC